MNTKTQFLIGMLVVLFTANIKSAYDGPDAYAANSGHPAVLREAQGVPVVGTVVNNRLTNYDENARFMTFPVSYSNGRTGTEQFATRHYHDRLAEEIQRLRSENESLRASAGALEQASIEAFEQRRRAAIFFTMSGLIISSGMLVASLRQKQG